MRSHWVTQWHIWTRLGCVTSRKQQMTLGLVSLAHGNGALLLFPTIWVAHVQRGCLGFGSYLCMGGVGDKSEGFSRQKELIEWYWKQRAQSQAWIWPLLWAEWKETVAKDQLENHLTLLETQQQLCWESPIWNTSMRKAKRAMSDTVIGSMSCRTTCKPGCWRLSHVWSWALMR